MHGPLGPLFTPSTPDIGSGCGKVKKLQDCGGGAARFVEFFVCPGFYFATEGPGDSARSDSWNWRNFEDPPGSG
jgi:hypothetical protein